MLSDIILFGTLLLNAGAVINFKLPTSRDEGFIEKMEMTAGMIHLHKVLIGSMLHHHLSFQVLQFLMKPNAATGKWNVLMNKSLWTAHFTCDKAQYLL
ncbi:small integral membrane protein 7-like isoform X1 [Dermacentor variabilis]|uniref:small integral membrane protein 7-like isoform X1 n=1 Tax=Dermacentor variabilis TaxID=34621 RepID=UPI003F5AF88D